MSPVSPVHAGPQVGVIGLFVLATAIWSSTWLVITFQLGHVAPEASVAYRFALAALVLAAWCIATRRPLRFPLRVHGWLALQGTLYFGLNYVALYKAEQYIASGLVAVVFSLIVFSNLIGARLAFGTPVRRHELIAAALGVFGVTLMFLPELAPAHPAAQFGLGLAYAGGSTLVTTGGTLVSMRLQRARLPILSTTTWGMAYGAAVAAIVATVSGIAWSFEPTLRYVAALVYLAVFGSVVAFTAYLLLLKRIGPTSSSYVGVATPVVAMLLSTIAEGYRWEPLAAFGIVLAVAGNVIVLRGVRRS